MTGKTQKLILFIAFSLFFSPLFAQEAASKDEMLAPGKVGREGMFPVYANDIIPGSYEISAESSSSMFRIVKSILTVNNGELKIKISLSGKGYSKLFLGSGEEAANSNGRGEILFSEDENSQRVFEFSIPALNQPVKCAALSAKKNKWYDRDILFDAASLPAQSLLISPEAEELPLKDGSYLISVNLEGGSGKASIQSPAKVTVKNGKAFALIQWSSSNYDYMKVNHQTFNPDLKALSKDGLSVFEIPVYAFDKKIPVIADTTAMSQPHEIQYWLTFDSASAKSDRAFFSFVSGKSDAFLLIWVAFVFASLVILYLKRRFSCRKKS